MRNPHGLTRCLCLAVLTWTAALAAETPLVVEVQNTEWKRFGEAVSLNLTPPRPRRPRGGRWSSWATMGQCWAAWLTRSI